MAYPISAETREVEAGQMVIVPPNTPHTFLHTSDGLLRQIDILPCDHIITEWLEAGTEG